MAGGVPLLDWEVEELMEELAPVEREAVGEALAVLLPLRVVEGVASAVPEHVAVALPVGLPVPVGVPDREADQEVLLL